MPEGEDSSTVENVRVVVRLRPMDQKEKAEGASSCVSVDAVNNTVAVTRNNVNPPEPPRIYTYDAVFGEETTQMDIYVATARPIVEQVLRGYNGTIFAYGQTGTGKTHTMAGGSTPQMRGVIPNAFAHIFSHIADATDDEKFLVCVTYLEIYNEEVRDLLGGDPRRSLEVKERPDIGVFVKDLSGYVVHNADELDKIMGVGDKNRAVGATAMNERSSRSHAIFTVTVESGRRAGRVTMGKLHLVDLAGSERQSKTQTSGDRLREAAKINQSLSALGAVMASLVDGRAAHIPYRNSKLTRLLQDSLGGNSKTVMIATIGPSEAHYVETISTLRYASRAKRIENRTHLNTEPGDALLTRFQQEIDQLKKQLEETNQELEVEKDDFESELEVSAEDDSEWESLDPEERKEKRKIRREEKEKIKREKAHQAREVLEQKKAELQRTKKQQEELREKLTRLESKVLVGGENLLEKAEAQRQLLDQAAKELDARRAAAARLTHTLQQKEAERLDLEERYSSLQEENLAKTRKLRRAVQQLAAAKAELADQQREQQRELEALLEAGRALRRELQLAGLVLDHYIPQEYQALIDKNVHWNEQAGEWQVRCVAYTGNNLHAPHRDHRHRAQRDPPDLSDRYLSYADVSGRASTAQRPRTALRVRH